MKYQDTWRRGTVIETGYRECADRYEIVKAFCKSNLKPGFSACDIGANMAYFPIRLIEDFSARATTYEFHQYEKRLATIGNIHGLLYLKRKISLADIDAFPTYDLILAMSVLHHVSESPEAWISALRKYCRFLIVELAGKDSSRVQKLPDFTDGELIGEGMSHLKSGARRQIIAFRNEV